MRKTHLILLIIAAIMGLFSAYSLAAINQVYRVNFEWYSQYNDTFTDESRDISRDKWMLQDTPRSVAFNIISDDTTARNSDGEQSAVETASVPATDLSKYIMLYC